MSVTTSPNPIKIGENTNVSVESYPNIFNEESCITGSENLPNLTNIKEGMAHNCRMMEEIVTFSDSIYELLTGNVSENRVSKDFEKECNIKTMESILIRTDELRNSLLNNLKFIKSIIE